jgi:hypothetical protein
VSLLPISLLSTLLFDRVDYAAVRSSETSTRLHEVTYKKISFLLGIVKLKPYYISHSCLYDKSSLRFSSVSTILFKSKEIQ